MEEVEQEVIEEAPVQRSALAEITFYDLYIFLWKLAAAIFIFVVPFVIVYLMVAGRR